MTTELVNEATGEIVETIGADEARRLTTEAQNEFRSSREHFDRAWSLIEQAVEGGGHVDLGYRSPGDYLHSEFDGVLSGLDVSSRRVAVRTMTDWGLSTRAIAQPLGVSNKTVSLDQRAPVTEVTPEPGDLASIIPSGIDPSCRIEDDVDLNAEADLVASAELMEDTQTSQDAPETPQAENGISEPAEATEAEGPEPALSLSQVITGEAAGEVPAVDDPGDAIQPERGADLASPPAPSNVVGIDGKTYKRPSSRRVPRPAAERTLASIQSQAARAAREAQTLTPDQIRRVRAEAGHVTTSLRQSIEALQRLVDSLDTKESK